MTVPISSLEELGSPHNRKSILYGDPSSSRKEMGTFTDDFNKATIRELGDKEKQSEISGRREQAART